MDAVALATVLPPHMNVASTALLALAMSTDAFAAAVGKGTALRKPRWSEALRTGLIFGVIEAITPLVGWALGHAASGYVTAWDHWIAFTLLLILGFRMIRASAQTPDDQAEAKPDRHGFWMLAVTGFATSIDAMAVGVGLHRIDHPVQAPRGRCIGARCDLLHRLTPRTCPRMPGSVRLTPDPSNGGAQVAHADGSFQKVGGVEPRNVHCGSELGMRAQDDDGKRVS